MTLPFVDELCSRTSRIKVALHRICRQVSHTCLIPGWLSIPIGCAIAPCPKSETCTGPPTRNATSPRKKAKTCMQRGQASLLGALPFTISEKGSIPVPESLVIFTSRLKFCRVPSGQISTTCIYQGVHSTKRNAASAKDPGS